MKLVKKNFKSHIAVEKLLKNNSTYNTSKTMGSYSSRDKTYKATYYQKHKEEKFKCELCDIETTLFNKYHHLVTKKHLLAKRITEKFLNTQTQ